MQTTPAVMTVQLLNLLTSILMSYDTGNEAFAVQDYENIMAYAVAWSCGALFEPEDRVKFNSFLRDHISSPPQCEAGLTIFDYFVDPKTRQFQKWVAPDWTPPKGVFSFSSILIPTLDSERSVNKRHNSVTSACTAFSACSRQSMEAAAPPYENCILQG